MTDWFSEETLKEALDILLHEMPMALWETVYVTVLSTFFAVLIGLPLGVLLVVGEKGGVLPLPRWLLSLLNLLINILRSVSRTMPDCNTDEENEIVSKARRYIAAYEDMAELIRLGAYKKGSNKEVDEAIFYYPKIESFLTQKKNEKVTLAEGYMQLKEILDTPYKAS